MIGLPYLFRVISPLLDKLITEEQKTTLDISLSGKTEVFDGVDIKDFTSTTMYELDSDKYLFVIYLFI